MRPSIRILCLVALLAAVACSESPAPVSTTPAPAPASLTGASEGTRSRTSATPPPPPIATDLASVSVFGFVGTATELGDYSPIPDAIVGATNLDTMELENLVFTNRDGLYLFEDLSGDRYRFDVAALGYRRPRPEYTRADPDIFEIQRDFWLTRDKEAPTINRGRFRRSAWDALGFDAYECPTPEECPDYWMNEAGETYPVSELIDRILFVLPTTSPNFHIQTHNEQRARRLSSTWVRRFRDAIPEIVSDLTGEHYGGEITSGREGVDAANWINIEASTEDEDPQWERDDEGFWCGRAAIGAIQGQIWLNHDRIGVSESRSKCGWRALLAHEIGHAFGFFHVSDTSNVMAPAGNPERFSRTEQYHARLAYAYGRFTPYFAGPQTMAAQMMAAPEPPPSPIIRCPVRVR